mmetsp:Transcript_2391/g.6538  ORF Transcript_2391/g.6538 Transcript_2391/m.6538 type:complete len:83 (-) Transcript_2391:6-254(-)|eukprot:scaffold230990_cov26-Tisochrysis_lutea.AAC.1
MRKWKRKHVATPSVAGALATNVQSRREETLGCGGTGVRCVAGGAAGDPPPAAVRRLAHSPGCASATLYSVGPAPNRAGAVAA